MKKYAGTLALSLAFAALASSAGAQVPIDPSKMTFNPKTFDTPQKAAEAFVAAAQKEDKVALGAILGVDPMLLTTGNLVSDDGEMTSFARKAKEKMALDPDPLEPDMVYLQIGNDAWEVPAPIVRVSKGKWQFDAREGLEEIAARQIGGNELDAIAILRGYADAQRVYASAEHDGSGLLQYAHKAVSSPGKQDGLSWTNADGTAGGPVGETIAKVLWDGKTGQPQAYNGYYFRMLDAQGASAPGGARRYVVKGAMIGGFAMIAWPEKYGITGIQTFLVGPDGAVYQKNLGEATATTAPAIATYDPDKSWMETGDEE
jgi:hypothetical protein